MFILFKKLLELKRYNVKLLVGQFPRKCLNVGSICKLLQKLRVTGSVLCHPWQLQTTQSPHSW